MSGDAETSVHEGERYGDYEVIRPLTSGGMADIFLARKLGAQGFQKLVVVKRIRRELVKDDHLIDMFIDEAHVAAKLDHPNVVSTSDLGEIETSYFMAMEYLRGQTLRNLQKRLDAQNKMLPPQFWARVLEHALDGLHYAHELRNDDGNLMNLVHRDFTPSNIMITYSGTVKVIDFGVAHVEDPSQRHETRVGTIKGKISYLAPEQCMAQKVDRRADVFAAGIVLWELLSRRSLFDGPSDAAIIVAIMREPIPLPGVTGQPLDPILVEIVMKALEREPNRRFQSAGEMRDALRDFLRRYSSQIDATEIGKVVSQVFEDERTADEKLVQAARDPSKMTPLPRTREPGSKSGSGRSRGSQSGASARGQLAENSTGPSAVVGDRSSKLMPLLVAAVILVLGGAGMVWWFTRGAPTVQPPVVAAKPVEAPPPAPPKPVEAPPPVAPPPAKPVEVVAAPEPPAPKPTAPRPPKSSSPSESTGGYGFLDFDTRPYTTVYIGKKKVGDTPMLGVKVPAGKLTLTLVNEEAGIRETYIVTIPKDGHVFKKLKL